MGDGWWRWVWVYRGELIAIGVATFLLFLQPARGATVDASEPSLR